MPIGEPEAHEVLLRKSRVIARERRDPFDSAQGRPFRSDCGACPEPWDCFVAQLLAMTGEGSRSSQRRLLSLFLGGALSLTKMALPEIVWVLGRTSVVPKGVPSFVRRGVGR